MILKAVTRDSKISGKGIFANKTILAGESIFIVKGTKIKFPYSKTKYSYGPNWLALDTRMWINPRRGNLWTFINHSCRPDAGIKGTVTIVALRKIQKGEEITIDYSITEEDPNWRMKCTCNQDNCRKIIRSVKFLDTKILKSYMPYIPRFAKKYLK